jgi:GT2 family glycosyltransferase
VQYTQTGRIPRVGILILNYHEPQATLACVRKLLEVEGPETCVLWLENDAEVSRETGVEVLRASGLPWTRIDPAKDPLPAPGHIGFIAIPKNLGYAGGNNVGLRFLHLHGVEFTWVMNNDTLVAKGSSSELIRAAELRPEVALWGMWVSSADSPDFIGLRIQQRDFAVAHVFDPLELEVDPMSFINGCAMFFKTDTALAIGGMPEEYFMYYEDQAFTWELRRRGLKIAAAPGVQVFHSHSLSTGHRSRFTEFYCRRNRWYFINKYFPENLKQQERLFWFYQTQKLLFRFRFDRIRLEWQAYWDFKHGQLGRTHRNLSTRHPSK